MDLRSPETAELDALLEFILPSIDGEMALSIVSRVGEPLYRVWYYLGDREYCGSAASVREAVAKAYLSCCQVKRCSRCGETRPVIMFARRPGAKDGRAFHCLPCDRERKKKWYPRANRPSPIRDAIAAASPRTRKSA